jgi:drug/metabolite transporter (DMT)-like permease
VPLAGLALALSASICWGLADFFGGLWSKSVRVLVVAFVSQIAGATVVGAILLARMTEPSAHATFYAMLAGVSGTVGIICLYQALSIGAMGVVAPIASASVLLPVIVGIVGGDNPSLPQIVGMVAVLAGVLLVTRSPSNAPATRDRSVWLAVAAALGIGGILVFLEKASAQDPYWAVFIFRCTSIALIAVAILVQRQRRVAIAPNQVTTKILVALASIGILDTGANLLYSLATTHGLLSITAMLASLYPIVTIVMARAVLQQRISRHQSLGVIVAMTGVALLAA